MDDSERLRRFEKMLSDVESEYESIEAQLNVLQSEGKLKGAAFKQLLARKLALRQLLGSYERHGLR